MASKLSLYNDALEVLGERKLASLAESRAPRRRLDSVWDGGAVKFCLEQGFWNHAMADVKITHSPSVDPAYGYQFAFDKPSDWCRTFMISADETYSVQLLEFEDQLAYWWANCDPIYVRYVSNDDARGNDLSLWPESFTRYVAHYFAWRICKSTTGSNADKDALGLEMKKLLVNAQSKDAMNETTRFPERGSWSTSRRGNNTRRDGGPRGNLIG